MKKAQPAWIIEHRHGSRPVLHLGGDEGMTECGAPFSEHSHQMTAVTVMSHCRDCVRQRSRETAPAEDA